MKRPSFQFYPADWRKDAALQSCSIAARGLWIEVMCIAHECEPYGHLTINGKAMTPAQVGRLVGLSVKESIALLDELEEAGVLSRSDDGTIFSRRMVRDEDIRQRRAAGGEAGSSHGVKGKEYGSKGGRPKKERGVFEHPIEPPPSSSSSPSGFNKSPLPPAASPPSVELFPGLLPETWKAFRDHRQRLRAPLTPRAERLLMTKLAELCAGGEDPNAVVDRSIELGWKGLFQLNGGGKTGNGTMPRTREQWASWGQQHQTPAKRGESMDAYVARLQAQYEASHP